MPELLLELFSEEVPARMQARGAADLARLVAEALGKLSPGEMRGYSGPRRIAVAGPVQAGVAASVSNERGPRVTAPEQALAGFLRKHGASRDDLRQEGEFWVLRRELPGLDAATVIAREIPGVLRRFPWPKSMRWGDGSRFTWVRPLRRILCVLDGEVVDFDLRDGDDDGHGLASSNLTEGHRFLSPGAFCVASETQWRDESRERHVIVEADERRRLVWDGIVAAAAEHGLTVVEDAGLLDEVAGLVEWPVPLLGRIDAAFMDLPPEVMQVSMRVNQRYFALHDAQGNAAPRFAFAANIKADDGGAAIVAGNERVLRARFFDARYFWDLDRTRTLESRVEDLRTVTFHAKIGTQYQRALRLEQIAGQVAQLIGAPVEQSRRAGLLCKADLTTGMVGEFPELQGVMGGYYARANEDRAVADAIRDHYAPRGPDDAVSSEPVTVAVAVADKLDQLVQFFAAGEKPTGSGDPFALRRAGLGALRLIQANQSSVSLTDLLVAAGANQHDELVLFLKERLRGLWRAQGHAHDALAAAFAGSEDRIGDLENKVLAVEQVSPDLLAGYRRAANILRAETTKDGPHNGEVDPSFFITTWENRLWDETRASSGKVDDHLATKAYQYAAHDLGKLRTPLDSFFDNVVVNSEDSRLRENRLRMLSTVVSLMNRVADFSQIQG